MKKLDVNLEIERKPNKIIFRFFLKMMRQTTFLRLSRQVSSQVM
jgi:hypothetical protein